MHSHHWAQTDYKGCADCGQYVRNTPLDWHHHECGTHPLNQRANRRKVGQVSSGRGVTGFPSKVRPGGSGSKFVMEADLELALIELTTDLSRWNEFAEYEGNIVGS